MPADIHQHAAGKSISDGLGGSLRGVEVRTLKIIVRFLEHSPSPACGPSEPCLDDFLISNRRENSMLQIRSERAEFRVLPIGHAEIFAVAARDPLLDPMPLRDRVLKHLVAKRGVALAARDDEFRSLAYHAFRMDMIDRIGRHAAVETCSKVLHGTDV